MAVSAIIEPPILRVPMQGGDEFVYVLTNPSLPGLVKIGRTDRSVEERARELSAATGVPTEFAVYREFRVADSASVERAVHLRLKDFRLSGNREFFSIEPEVAVEVIVEVVGDQSAPRLDNEAEDELLARATELIGRFGKVWPSLLVSTLSIPHSDAERAIVLLRGRGVIDETGTAKFAGAVRGRQNRTAPVTGAPNSNNPSPVGDGTYDFPPLELLQKQDMTWNGNESEHRQNSDSLLRVFESHGMKVTPGEIHVGPTLTCHEFVPSIALRLELLPAIESAVINELGAKGARVLGAIPGKQSIVVELPNRISKQALLRSILETEDWCSQTNILPAALGQYASGRPIIRDLANSPNILITGAPGAGRSTVKWTPKVGQRGTVLINQIGTVQHVQKTTPA
jgi:DNA segregation ATPase FtsK/SpoIIIE-like protein